jgi:hypothetical protein
VGFIRLASKAQDAQEGLGRALLAKAAVLKAAMVAYPRYLYTAGLVALPPYPDWQVRYTAGKGYGNLFNYDWTGAADDPRQVRLFDQFGVYLFEHSGLGSGYSVMAARTPGWVRSAHLICYDDMTPELARLLADSTGGACETCLEKFEANAPNWYDAFAPGMFGEEHGLLYPIDSYQAFMAKAWLQHDSADNLARYASIPWLAEGDLFYIHKLAEAVKAYRGVAWSSY